MSEKEIWKLLELLNEYVEKYNKSDLYYTFDIDLWWLFCYDDVTDFKWWTMQDEAMVICSKRFGFIQRLVEQDKIDISKLDKEEKNQNIDICIYKKLSRDEENTERLLMLLSIQENPISFLLSLLKDD